MVRRCRLNGENHREYRVTLDGTAVSMVLSLTGNEDDVYRGDISGFSGRSAELKTETGTGTDLFDLPRVFIDNISFSTLVVPEPGAYALLGIGLVGLGWWRRVRA